MIISTFISIIAILCIISCYILFTDFEKRFCNAISYIEILKKQKKIDEFEAHQLLKILRWKDR